MWGGVWGGVCLRVAVDPRVCSVGARVLYSAAVVDAAEEAVGGKRLIALLLFCPGGRVPHRLSRDCLLRVKKENESAPSEGCDGLSAALQL